MYFNIHRCRVFFALLLLFLLLPSTFSRHSNSIRLFGLNEMTAIQLQYTTKSEVKWSKMRCHHPLTWWRSSLLSSASPPPSSSSSLDVLTVHFGCIHHQIKMSHDLWQLILFAQRRSANKFTLTVHIRLLLSAQREREKARAKQREREREGLGAQSEIGAHISWVHSE